MAEKQGDQYRKAGHLFKAELNLEEAAKAYKKAAEWYLEDDDCHHFAATVFIEAAHCYNGFQYEEAVKCIQQAVDIFIAGGHFSIAAKNVEEIAEICEANKDLDNAFIHFKKAAQLYEGEQATSRANVCWTMVAKLAAVLYCDYAEAIEIFEKIAKRSLTSSLLKWGAKKFFFSAAVCYLANEDITGAEQALVRYGEWDTTFPMQPEYKFAHKLTVATSNLDVEAFDKAIADYKDVRVFFTWEATILERVRVNIETLKRL